MLQACSTRHVTRNILLHVCVWSQLAPHGEVCYLKWLLVLEYFFTILWRNMCLFLFYNSNFHDWTSSRGFFSSILFLINSNTSWKLHRIIISASQNQLKIYVDLLSHLAFNKKEQHQTIPYELLLFYILADVFDG